MELASLGIFGMFFLVMLMFISTVSIIKNTNIQSDIAQVSCNYPLYNAIDYLNNTVVYGKGGAFYQCFYCFTCVPQGVSITINIRPYNATSFGGSFPNGWFMYAGDTIGMFGEKTFATLDMGRSVMASVTPFGFNILGYTFNSLNGLGQLLIIAIYTFCYLGIAILIYKAVSPYVGA